MRADGTKYQIAVMPFMDNYRNEAMTYRVEVYFKNKGKRKWMNIPRGIHEYKWRSLSMSDREKYDADNQLRFVSSNEIYKARLSAWELMKPKQ